MTDKQMIIDKLKNDIACKENIINHLAEYNIKLQDQLARKEQECEELKEEIKHYKQIAQYHGNLSVKYTNKSAKLKQTLTDIEFWVREFLKRTGQVVPNEIRQILRIISEVR